MIFYHHPFLSHTRIKLYTQPTIPCNRSGGYAARKPVAASYSRHLIRENDDEIARRAFDYETGARHAAASKYYDRFASSTAANADTRT